MASNRKRTMPYLSAAFKGKKIPQTSATVSLDAVNKSLLKELMEDNIDTALIKNEIESLSDAHELLPITCREKLLHFLHHLPLEIFMILLIIVDVLIVLLTMILEVYIDEEALLESQQMTKEFISYLLYLNKTENCQISPSVLQSPDNITATHGVIHDIITTASDTLATGLLDANSTGTDGSSHGRRKRSTGTGASTTTAPSISHILENVNHVLHYISIAILCVLVLEVFLKIIAHGKYMLRYKIGIMDAIVNVASLIIDIMLTDASLVGAIGKVLVILTLIWRVFRILNAIIMTSKARSELRIRLLKKTKQVQEDKLEMLRNRMTHAKSEIERLRQLAGLYGAPAYELKVFAELLPQEENTATFGIQASMLQLLRVNDAIAGRPFSHRPKEAEQKVVFKMRRHSSLPDLISLNGRVPALTLSDHHRSKPANLTRTLSYDRKSSVHGGDGQITHQRKEVGRAVAHLPVGGRTWPRVTHKHATNVSYPLRSTNHRGSPAVQAVQLCTKGTAPMASGCHYINHQPLGRPRKGKGKGDDVTHRKAQPKSDDDGVSIGGSGSLLSSKTVAKSSCDGAVDAKMPDDSAYKDLAQSATDGQATDEQNVPNIDVPVMYKWGSLGHRVESESVFVSDVSRSTSGQQLSKSDSGCGSDAASDTPKDDVASQTDAEWARPVSGDRTVVVPNEGISEKFPAASSKCACTQLSDSLKAESELSRL